MDAIIMTIHYTHGWTQQCVESFFSHFPEKEIIVFNNNPFPDQKVNKTRGGTGLNAHWIELCQKEANYVRNHPNIIVVEMPHKPNKRIIQLPTHGEVLDFAFDWCQKKGYRSLLHIEPDCEIKGCEWLENMTCNLKDKWVSGIGEIRTQGDSVMPLCPTLWKIESILKLKISFKKVKGLNTAQKIMMECQSQEKISSIPYTKEFIHFSKGSKRPFSQ